jgi:beta-glucanase (GH16 family)
MQKTILPIAVVLLVQLIACSTQNILGRNNGLSDPPEGYTIVWQDEFDISGNPNIRFWSYENGLVRNNELQYYRPENAHVKDGTLVIEGKRERVRNEDYEADHQDWRKNSEFAEYTSASIHTRGKKSFQYGIFEIRAKIDTALGLWPAIWTLGISKPWPANGEIDIMEYYRVNDQGTLLANAAWASKEKRAEWDEAKIPLSSFLAKDPDWLNKFHIWKMDWTEDYIRLYLDGKLLNEVDLKETTNPDGFNPFHQPHYILLNLAIGSNGGDPSATSFPKRYEVDYVRVYQRE